MKNKFFIFMAVFITALFICGNANATEYEMNKGTLKVSSSYNNGHRYVQTNIALDQGHQTYLDYNFNIFSVFDYETGEFLHEYDLSEFILPNHYISHYATSQYYAVYGDDLWFCQLNASNNFRPDVITHVQLGLGTATTLYTFNQTEYPRYVFNLQFDIYSFTILMGYYCDKDGSAPFIKRYWMKMHRTSGLIYVKKLSSSHYRFYNTYVSGSLMYGVDGKTICGLSTDTFNLVDTSIEYTAFGGGDGNDIQFFYTDDYIITTGINMAYAPDYSNLLIRVNGDPYSYTLGYDMTSYFNDGDVWSSRYACWDNDNNFLYVVYGALFTFDVYIVRYDLNTIDVNYLGGFLDGEPDWISEKIPIDINELHNDFYPFYMFYASKYYGYDGTLYIGGYHYDGMNSMFCIGVVTFTAIGGETQDEDQAVSHWYDILIDNWVKIALVSVAVITVSGLLIYSRKAGVSKTKKHHKKRR